MKKAGKQARKQGSNEGSEEESKEARKEGRKEESKETRKERRGYKLGPRPDLAGLFPCRLQFLVERLMEMVGICIDLFVLVIFHSFEYK